MAEPGEPDNPASPPPQPPSGEVTRLIQAANQGQPRAAEELLPLVYNHLRALAQRYLTNERKGHTLQATALVHEAYLKLVGGEEIPWSGRTGFFVAAAESMRRILIDHARRSQALKRGGADLGIERPRGSSPASEPRASRNLFALNEALDLALEADPDEIVAFDGALLRLTEQMPQAASVVRLRFYAGLSVEQTAKALGLSERTVNREWTYARAFLFRELGETHPDSP